MRSLNNSKATCLTKTLEAKKVNSPRLSLLAKFKVILHEAFERIPLENEETISQAPSRPRKDRAEQNTEDV
jgi:hypothetical protein